ncbi:lipocalin family protein [Ferruginibacter sp. HRS2-29]|uniref:lipocalin family protein n=1 Tax=Ferruginibacter sp. HRS2-29 TaxID=2487334 RepID=UPI0020CDC45F|nr:lipocalin family protein [Ferruginibacter sp. HRS2-29]MCP9750243.1 hypothetical protein [Ferruginibacter sp. HRS2-29]
MKNFLFAAMAVMLFAATGCDKDDDNPSNVISAENVKNTLITGTWRVSYYYDTDHEETSNFTGYNFTFQANGIVSAANDILSHTGTWSAVNDSNRSKLVLDFATPAEFEEISEDWEVVEISATKVQLKHVSGGGGGTDLLTFTKN